MEGLIPLVYRTLKKNKTRRQYECLSSGAAQSYNITDFYVNGQGLSQVYMKPTSPGENNIGGLIDITERNGHRRHMSMEDFSMAYSTVDGMKTGASPTPSLPKFKRFRSHRMFSCVTSG